jgi:hypothetical protein
MNSNPPINFEEKVRLPKGNTNADYPYALKATDLMKDFVFATLDMDESLYTEQTGMGGHRQRRLKIPALPSGGTFVLGAKDGTIQWIETEDCDDDQA